MPARSRDIHAMTFWTRELRLPLFWLTDERHQAIRALDNLMLLRGSVLHCYHLNDARTKAVDRGRRLFCRKGGPERYADQATAVTREMKQTIAEYRHLKVRKLDDDELKNRFFKLLALLDRYSNLYTRTEAVYVACLEDQTTHKRTAIRLGKIRFALRREGEPLFYVLLGILLKEVARRFRVSVRDVFFYTYDELAGLFKGKIVRRATLGRRRQGYALLTLDGRQRLLTGAGFRRLRKLAIVAEKHEALTGRTAMSGHAIGRARVILHDRRDIANRVMAFKAGEVLVTEMTRPDTIMACHRAVAIITDEGGITSHAAIISREFKIPCIIGANRATHLIKTGDLIEVDADNGRISILKKAS